MDAAAVWAAVSDERRRLAREIADLAPDVLDRPGRCEGSRVRDVLRGEADQVRLTVTGRDASADGADAELVHR